jgi:excisionase family DNA binding protein
MQCEELSEGLTIREVARLNKISEVTVRRHVNSGKIPSYMVGGARRIRVDDAAGIQRTDVDDVDAEIKRLVDLAPKLTPAQRDTIAALFATCKTAVVSMAPPEKERPGATHSDRVNPEVGSSPKSPTTTKAITADRPHVS